MNAIRGAISPTSNAISWPVIVVPILAGLSSFLCKFFRKNFMGRGTSPFVELAALKLHLIKAST